MEQELTILIELFYKPGLENITRATTRRYSSISEPLVLLDIVYINIAGFYMQARYRDNTIFSTSLYELDRMIKKKETPDDNITVEEIKSKILVQNQAYTNIFSKVLSNCLFRTARMTTIYSLS
jgi:hypothetical protein